MPIRDDEGKLPQLRFPPATILVAFDFSKRSLEAWKYARALAEHVHARLEAIYVSRWVPAAELVPALPLLGPGERLRLERRMARLLGGAAGIRIAEGDVPREILKAARESRAGLIVLATRGRTGLRRVFGGSVTEAVVRLSPFPVLSVHGPASLPRTILAPVSLQPYSLAGFDFAQELARALGSSITLLHIEEPRLRSTVSFRKLERLAGKAPPGVKVDLRIGEGNVVRNILDEAPRHGLIVLVAHRRGIFRDAVIGTTAEQVLRRSEAPVLSVPAFVPAALPPGRRELGRRRGRAGARLLPSSRRGRPRVARG